MTVYLMLMPLTAQASVNLPFNLKVLLPNGTLYTSDPITQNSELEYTMAYIKQAVAMLMDPPLNPNTLVTTIGAQYEISNEVTILGLFNNFGFTELDTLVVTASGSVSNDPTLVGFDGVQ